MAERTVFHVTPNGKQWQLKQVTGAAADDPTLFATKTEAIKAGRERAHGTLPSQLVIHDEEARSWTSTPTAPTPSHPAASHSWGTLRGPGSRGVRQSADTKWQPRWHCSGDADR